MLKNKGRRIEIGISGIIIFLSEYISDKRYWINKRGTIRLQ
jgi:hypothetical protein